MESEGVTPLTENNIPADLIKERINNSITTLAQPFVANKKELGSLIEYSFLCEIRSLVELDSKIIESSDKSLKEKCKIFLKDQIIKGRKT